MSHVGELPPARRRYYPFDISNWLQENICMRTFEYHLFVNKHQAHLLMECLKETRLIYNEMLESVKAQYEGTGGGKPAIPDCGVG